MTASALALPAVDLARVMGRVDTLWRPDTAPHALVLGMNGAGKTRLIRSLFLPLASYDRVLIVDVKGTDPSWSGCGAVVDRIRPGFGADREGGGPAGTWFRLVLGRGDRDAAKRVLREALAVVAEEGHTVLVIDEVRAVTDPEELACRALVEALVLRGRSDAVSTILAGQGTAWLPAAVRDQWSFAFAGALRTEATRKLAAEILGYPRELVPMLRSLAKRQWCYVDGEAGGAMALTDTLDWPGSVDLDGWPDPIPWDGQLTPAPSVDGAAELVCPQCGGPAVLSPRATLWLCGTCGLVDPDPVAEAAEAARERAAQRATRAIAVRPNYAGELVEAMTVGAARAELVGELSRALAALRVHDGCRGEVRQRADRLAGGLRVLVDAAGRADAAQLDQVRELAGGIAAEVAAVRIALDQDRADRERYAAGVIEDDDQAEEVDQVDTPGMTPGGRVTRYGPGSMVRWPLPRALPAGGQAVTVKRCSAFGCPRDAVTVGRDGRQVCGPHAYPGGEAAVSVPAATARGVVAIASWRQARQAQRHPAEVLCPYPHALRRPAARFAVTGSGQLNIRGSLAARRQYPGHLTTGAPEVRCCERHQAEAIAAVRSQGWTDHLVRQVS